MNSIVYELIRASMSGVSLLSLSKSVSLTAKQTLEEIANLIDEGYDIEDKEGRYYLGLCPYDLIPEKIAYDLRERGYQIPLLFQATIASTNSTAKEMIDEYPEGFILFTREQVLGRGRMTRTWQMTKDKDMAMSIVLPSDNSPDDLFSIIQLTSLSVNRVIRRYIGEQSYIKWPNDIITLEGQKICGILTENILIDNIIRYIVVGIGINVNSVDLPEYAQSICELLDKREIDINQFYCDVIEEFLTNWHNFSSGIESIINQWHSQLAWLGQDVQLDYYDQQYLGQLRSVRGDGSLVIEIEGQDQVFLSGDLSHIKMRKQ